ncbi:F-box protein At1g49990 [Raphanus sativus]|uniref:F-box protein At1g49990 n=1 Tax=Raphanus sativus TaxID=3726 RepID=A0A6J0JTS5_RAPSA|nr:F-box protein At1g49990 [Raphanus sativus]
MEIGGRTVLEVILVEIIARLPLRTIARLKLVCKQWKSLIESSYLRRVFVSLHKNSSSSWSLMFGAEYPHPEAIGFHGCQTWDLQKSLGSYIKPFPRYLNLLASHNYFYVASSNGLVWINVFFTRTDNMVYSYKSFVGNPVLDQWVEIPPPPDQCIATGLVTRVENGIVSGFKVVRTSRTEGRGMGMHEWRVYVYSSETGLWTTKRLLSSHPVSFTGSYPPMNLNGMLYLRERGSDATEPGVLVGYDFYGPEDDDQCLVIHLPHLFSKDVRRCLTTSGADVIYIEILYPRLKVWKLNNKYSRNGEWWQLSREESVEFDAHCFPLAMNPFDPNIVYLWSQHHESLVTCNLWRQEFIVHQESETGRNSEGCYCVNTSGFKGYVKGNVDATTVIMLSPFVLQLWMDSVPRPQN